ncbi:hypothetical protein [Sphingomonas sp.]|nr:hypothetical protein [Sphingomonas sp.]
MIAGFALRTFRPGDMGMITARQALLYAENQSEIWELAFSR